MHWCHLWDDGSCAYLNRQPGCQASVLGHAGQRKLHVANIWAAGDVRVTHSDFQDLQVQAPSGNSPQITPSCQVRCQP